MKSQANLHTSLTNSHRPSVVRTTVSQTSLPSLYLASQTCSACCCEPSWWNIALTGHMLTVLNQVPVSHADKVVEYSLKTDLVFSSSGPSRTMGSRPRRRLWRWRFGIDLILILRSSVSNASPSSIQAYLIRVGADGLRVEIGTITYV
jgi:hypothetical protein